MGLKRDPCSGQSQLRSASFQLSTPPRWVHTAETAQVRPSTGTADRKESYQITVPRMAATTEGWDSGTRPRLSPVSR